MKISSLVRTSDKSIALLARPLACALGASALALIAGMPAASAADFTDGLRQYARGRILVEARAGLSNDDLEKVLKVHGGKRRKMGQSNIHVVDLPAGASEMAVVEQLRRNPNLKFVELDVRVKSTLAVTDPYVGSEWHLSKIGATTAWDTTQGAGVTIAILDSGVDMSHPDLVPNLVPGFNVYGNNTDTADVCGHGTAVAGSAAARTNNGVGVAGVAGQAKIMPIRIAYKDAASGGCYAYASTIASGITYAADHGARIANVSYGPLAGNATIQSAAQYMKSKGGLVFVSAGNDGLDQNITPTTSLIAVSATDSNDAKASWSSFGTFISLAAPGAGIWTTSQGGAYGGWNGTSFASPVAAGVAALMMAAAPSLDGAQIEQALFSSAVDLGTAGRDPNYGYGRVECGRRRAGGAGQGRRRRYPGADGGDHFAGRQLERQRHRGGRGQRGRQRRRRPGRAEGQRHRHRRRQRQPIQLQLEHGRRGERHEHAGGNRLRQGRQRHRVDPGVGQRGERRRRRRRSSDTTPPVVSIDNPVAGTVSGTVSVSVKPATTAARPASSKPCTSTTRKSPRATAARWPTPGTRAASPSARIP